MKTLNNESTQMVNDYSRFGQLHVWYWKTVGVESGFIYEEWEETHCKGEYKESEVKSFTPDFK